MPRDSQRKKLYTAETEASLGGKVKFPELPDCEAYLRKVWTAEWTQAHFERARVYPVPAIRDGRGATRATGSLRNIKLPRWARYDWVILHEIAHALTKERPAHGRDFARHFLALVRHFIGAQAGATLKVAFKKHRVRWKPKRALTPERLAQLRARGYALAAARKKEAPDGSGQPA